MGKQEILRLVVPCYNEEQILEESAARLLEKLRSLTGAGKIAAGSGILLVDDGSSDRTWEIVCALQEANPEIAGIRLSRNRGHQIALWAGLMTARKNSDAVISLDADLQDDIEVIDRFVEEFRNGADIVYGVRSCRDTDTFFKRSTAEAFYRLMNWFGVKILFNHADYRLMSRRALEALSEYREVNLFLRGIVPLLGFRQAVVTYERKAAERPTHYPLRKMLLLALDGITSFSVTPIRLITLLGIVMLGLSALGVIYYWIVYLNGGTVRGWTSQVFIILILGGLQLFATGVIGEYIGKIYMEVKARPRYFIEDERGTDGEKR